MDYYTADTHFWHRNVIEYCNRPWKTVEEMNSALIKNWNDTVSDEDIIYIIGDFSFGGAGKITSILERLKGYKILIPGNHDHNKNNRLIRFGINEVQFNPAPIEIFGHTINLSHFPYLGYEIDDRIFERQLEDDGNFLLMGHVHEAWKENQRQINVGVDVREYKPVSLPEIVKIIQGIVWKEEGTYVD